MRAVAILLFAAGCGSSPTRPPIYDLTLHANFSPPPASAPDLAIVSAQLHLLRVTAVSDCGAADARAQLDRLDLPLGQAAAQDWPSAPPGLYSGVRFELGDTGTMGLDLAAIFRGGDVHVSLSGGAVDVFCPAPRALQLGSRVDLELQADVANWFDGVDLSKAINDSDDAGTLISNEDNGPLAIQVIANIGRSFQLVCN